VLGWIALEFGALLEHIKAYLQFNFCSNGIKKQSIFKFPSAIFCHAYRLNCLHEQAENRCAAKLNIGEVFFGG